MITWVKILVGGLLCIAAPTAAWAERSRVAVQGEWLTVDGEPFLVKGVGYSPYRPGQTPWSSQAGLEVMAQDFERIRQAGFNVIRTWAPLSPEQLALAGRSDLMVLQGLWVDPEDDYTSEAFQDLTLEAVRREVERASTADNILAILVGNELSPERAFTAGLPQTDEVLRLAYHAAKETDPQRLVSHANWPLLSALDGSFWDLIGFNLYPYEPSSVSYSFGFRGYIEHLKRTIAREKPLIITEFGLSVSPQPGPRPGYGGYTPKAQAREVLALWDQAFQAGAQGACVFEWNDEWWKQGDYRGDEQVHDEEDAEEWFGLMSFASAEQLVPTPRPLYDALKTYNHAILTSPVSERTYVEELPVAVYATEAVRAVRFRLGSGRWQAATQLSPHWWKANLPVKPVATAQQLTFVMEAFDARRKRLLRRARVVWMGPSGNDIQLAIKTDRDRYEAIDGLQPMQFTITVTDTLGRPLPNQLVLYSIAEPQTASERVQSARTDGTGTIEGTYLVREPGVITLAAATAADGKDSQRRVGAERSVVIAQQPAEPAAQPGAMEPALEALLPSPWKGRIPDEILAALHPAPAFQLAEPGSEAVVDYAKYGRFHHIGTSKYRYEILDREGLARAVGEGIYPNEDGVFRDPACRTALLENRLEGSVWDFTDHRDPQLAFLKWAGTVEEAAGVKQFFTALTLERAGLWREAVKAYYATLIHFPDAIGWTEFKTPWYIGPVARDKIEAILRLHPELGLRLDGTRVLVTRGFDHDVDNDVVITSPGQFVSIESVRLRSGLDPEGTRRVESAEALSSSPQDLATVPVKRRLGKGRIQLRQYANRHWQLVVDGTPWVIRGISYQPSAVGESPDEGTLKDWMTADRNANGKPDGPFDTFVDANRNNRQDPDEPTVGDFALLKAMGVNTLRLYHHASNKALLRQLYEDDGMMVLMGDLVGMYTVGSGAKWEEGTNYLDPVQRKRMTDSVQQMVREFKDEPYILMWVLGNENNYGGVHGLVGGVGNAAQYPKEFYQFLNQLATWIHREDPHHPVAIANGEWLYLDLIARYAPAIDVFGANVYRGWHGFGRSFFEAVRDQLDRPVFISEFGCPAYQAGQPREVGELGQAVYHVGNWVDLEDNMAGRGVGNALGGIAFAWNDEWWKAGQPPRFSPHVQETTPNWSGPFPGGKMYEEWMGITSQGDGSASPYLRQLRKAYRLYERLWNN